MKHANISLFVAHVGCKHRCSFCDQNTITGTLSLPTAADIAEAVMIAQSSKNYSPETTEIAFFGGSFTAIEKEYMTELLDAACPYVEQGIVKGIRVSTRPDAISEEILKFVKSKGVTAIELGAQSMDDEILSLNKRGHTSKDVETASEMIKNSGIELGLQMMTGLYGSTPEKDMETAEKIIALNPKTVRIYPTIILEGTLLGVLYKKGEYDTYSLETTTALCADLLEKFQNAGIKVIRLGLHDIDKEKYLAGPWHPAFRELVDSRRYLKLALEKMGTSGKYNIYVNPSAISKMTGQSRSNIAELSKRGYSCKVLPDKNIKEMQVKVVKTEGNSK
ncbi:MAG: radical SAM protein [Clostridia bacterium]|nr:radical SAM protein [Clostridia bacterium]